MDIAEVDSAEANTLSISMEFLAESGRFKP
jgi:hypothetical protein